MMSKFKNLVFSALLSLGAFGAVTFTACTQDECKDVVCNNGGTCISGTCSCPTGYSGANCETEIRTTYVGDYKGSGSDNNGGTYSNFTMTFSTSGTGATTMTLTAKNSSGTPFLTLPITLNTNSTFTITSTVVGNYTYSGTGTVNGTSASVTINQAGSPNLVITFANLVKS